MTQPKVLLVCQLFYPELVSTGQTLTEFAEALVEKKTDVSVICGPITVATDRQTVPKDISYKGIHIQRVWGTQFSKLSFMGKLLNHISFAQSVFWALLFRDLSTTRVIVLTNPPFLGWILTLLTHLKSFRFDYLLFDLYPETAVACNVLKKNSLLTRIWHILNQWVYRRATLLLVIGRCMADLLRDQLAPKDHQKLKHLPMWCDTQLLQEKLPTNAANPFRKAWAKGAKFLVSYSGNMARFHDIQSVLLAAKSLSTSHPEIRFCFIGEGYRKAEVVAFVSEHALKNCEIGTYVDREDLATSLAAADAGIVSLLPGHEGLSVPSKTYGIMAVGNPVIGLLPERSEIAQLLTELPCGTVCPPNDWEALRDAIVDLFEHPRKAQKLGQTGQQAIQDTYHAGHAADRYLHWLKQTTEQRNP